MNAWQIAAVVLSVLLVVELEASCTSSSITNYIQVFSLNVEDAIQIPDPDAAQSVENQICLTTNTNTCSFCEYVHFL